MIGLLGIWQLSGIAYGDEIEEIAERECGACHGAKGVSEKPSIPSIGGFSDSAILDLLTTYENDLRRARRVQLEDGSETDMIEVIDAFSPLELEAIALYYSEQTWTPIEQHYDRTSAINAISMAAASRNRIMR